MNDRLFRTILKRYEAEIEDANYKIEAICEHNLVIPEHVDITGEIDKQLERIASAEDKLAAMRKYCGKKEARDILQCFKKFEKKYFFFIQKKCTFCTFDLEVLIYMTLGWTDYGTNHVLEYTLFCTIRCPTRASLSLL